MPQLTGISKTDMAKRQYESELLKEFLRAVKFSGVKLSFKRQ
jgi:hypothetical protein